MWWCPPCCDRISIVAILPGCVYWKIVEWFGLGLRDLKDHLVPTPLPWAGKSSARPGCSKLRPTWPWTLSGMEQGDRKHRSGSFSSLSASKWIEVVQTSWNCIFFFAQTDYRWISTMGLKLLWKQEGCQAWRRWWCESGMCRFCNCGFLTLWQTYLRTDDVFL